MENNIDESGTDFGDFIIDGSDMEEPFLAEDSSNSSKKPPVGMEFNTIEESNKFWENYGSNIGFGGRIKNTNRRKKDQVITSRTYVCSRAGTKYDDPRRVNSKHRPNTRCGCGVLMTVSLNSVGKYYVKDFVEDHNHGLEGKGIVKMHERAINVAKRAGLGPTMTYRCMAVEAGTVTENAKSCHKEVATPLPKLTVEQKADILIADVRRILERVCDDEEFEGVRNIINNSAHSFLDKYRMSKGKGQENVEPTLNGSMNDTVSGLKKKDNRETSGKRRMVGCTKGAPAAKKPLN